MLLLSTIRKRFKARKAGIAVSGREAVAGT
jgi:hypothetical protein